MPDFCGSHEDIGGVVTYQLISLPNHPDKHPTKLFLREEVKLFFTLSQIITPTQIQLELGKVSRKLGHLFI